MSLLADAQQGVYIEILARPKASRTAIDGVREGALVVKINAPPADGEANAELIRFLAKTLGVPKSSLELVRGGSARQKRVLVKGLSAAEAAQKLGVSLS